ncbi:hypothetical protein CFC21_015942 [Triticum aestivum]|uniref:Uncharacterized protein n=3 Tax=Triticum TaxID=4564 RepID=A0A9R1J0V8_WHEAT|nr:uncharacterized protein LOC119359132 [Triticum dicoccoides]XP_044452921.1 uncharacterized protein LOC123184958 [Triticum aestivum]XP_048560625.1 uncharacterized protein LOC125541202 [Triticum urartu]VAH27757.1 unnamed protein product [Triticum turgidum subsp. durum]KAF6999964.1 hypothetical protein CFC21_015934 [Triticum aestivum]KAF6999977.1 hypothetical protein CFC21_015942 [Triticum aestivum]
MPHHHGALPDEEAPSPRPSAAGCYTFLRSAASRRGHGHGYRRLESASVDVVRVEVGTTAKARSVFHVDPAVLEAEPVRRLLAAAGRRTAGGAVAVAVDALLFEHLLWLAATDGAAADDLSEIVEFYSEEEEDEEHHDDGHGFKLKR